MNRYGTAGCCSWWAWVFVAWRYSWSSLKLRSLAAWRVCRCHCDEPSYEVQHQSDNQLAKVSSPSHQCLTLASGCRWKKSGCTRRYRSRSADLSTSGPCSVDAHRTNPRRGRADARMPLQNRYSMEGRPPALLAEDIHTLIACCQCIGVHNGYKDLMRRPDRWRSREPIDALQVPTDAPSAGGSDLAGPPFPGPGMPQGLHIQWSPCKVCKCSQMYCIHSTADSLPCSAHQRLVNATLRANNKGPQPFPRHRQAGCARSERQRGFHILQGLGQTLPLFPQACSQEQRPGDHVGV